LADVRAVLFDFSGTLASCEARDDWFTGMELNGERRAEVMDRLTHPTASVTHHAWEYRDLDPALHREAYLHVLNNSGLTDEHAEGLYRRVTDPAEWSVYPDTFSVLKSLRQNGIRTAVVSNIAWDIRPVLTGSDVEEFVLSFEVGAAKPDTRIFTAALDRLGVAADETLMIGDSEDNDGAARELGCAFALVDPLPISQRPAGLIDALRVHGVAL
jgi:HAD superfamily hydrolase (TIGR01509 family)